jgi:integrase
MVLLATGSRPSAALELTGNQIDLKAGTIDLLPNHRTQNNKYRPIVKLPEFIRAIYHSDNLCSRERVVLNAERPMDSIKSSWNTARKNANLDSLVNPYSIRHTMAKWLRTCGVAPWETSGQLGHKRQGSEITEVYASFDPGYLADALEAIEGYFALVYESSPKLQKADWLVAYEPRCDLVAKYQRFIS